MKTLEEISEMIERSIEKQIEREMFEYRFQIEPLASEKGMYIKELPEGCTSLYTEKIEEIYE